ncbi:hypothetical protein [Mycobacterium parmense]|uniref:Uncharacterized protein n=1 Tax=Mycobacterium parmense TaxID=185642 RepID=A0A7I7Z337_9MYCO|nr:hypothetical protein [Mycobacterium parmense]MCV7352282.1 hypothetical protein [Mycobacterium parmense]BBZ47997.1 hypothetical protein MPRM_52780 [Mycobacterium parmense]
MTGLGCRAYAAGPLPPSNVPWVVEVGGWIAFGLVAVFLKAAERGVQAIP